MTLLIYADESGDLGWSFEKPYGQGGSSRYLTIFAVSLPRGTEHLPERVMRNLYKAGGWDYKKEKKWTDTPLKARSSFAAEAAKLATKHPEISYKAIVVCKERVQEHIRKDGNKLYNYMLKLLLVDLMASHASVTFIPDQRSIKVESGNSLHDYLQTTLWFELKAPTILETMNQDSRYCKNIQFADMMAGIVQTHFEFGKADWWDVVQPHVHIKRLYFPSSSD